MAVVIGCILWGSFYFLLIQRAGGWGADRLLGPVGPPAPTNSRQQPGLGTGGGGEVVGRGGLDRLTKVCSEDFQEPSDPLGKGCLGPWLNFTGSVSIAGFIKLFFKY